MCLSIAFAAWWVYIPEQLLTQPLAYLDPEYVDLVNDTFVYQICELHNSGFICMCDEQHLHTEVADVFAKDDVYDPLGIKEREHKAKALAVMVGA